MRSPMRHVGRTAALAVLIVTAIACTPGGSNDEADEVVPGVPTGTVAIPAERLTPFCQAMIDLSETLETDPPTDVDAFIIDSYAKIAELVPPEISTEFEAVLARLRGEPAPVTTLDPTVASSTTPAPATDPSTVTSTVTSTGPETGSTTPGAGTGTDGSVLPEGDEFFEEGYLPGDDPAERLNAYVDFVCRDSQNNPGPPATQPLADIAPTTEET